MWFISIANFNAIMLLMLLSGDTIADHEVSLPNGNESLFGLSIKHAPPIIKHLACISEVNVAILLLRRLVG